MVRQLLGLVTPSSVKLIGRGTGVEDAEFAVSQLAQTTMVWGPPHLHVKILIHLGFLLNSVLKSGR